MLGDANLPGYEAPDNSFFTLDYFRQKALDYQNVLNCLDRIVSAANDLLAVGVDAQSDSDIRVQLDEIASKKFQIQATAEAINAAAVVVNAAGGRFPVLSLPPTLGIAPIVLPAAGIAAIAVAATLIAWGIPAIQALNERMQRAQVLEAITDPAEKAAAAQQMFQLRAAADEAASQSMGGALSEIGSAVKWVAIGVLVFIAFQMLNKSKLLR